MNLYNVEGTKKKTVVNLEKIDFCCNKGDYLILQVNGVKHEVEFNSEEDADKFIKKLNHQ